MKVNFMKLTALGLLFLLVNNASKAGEPNKKPTTVTQFKEPNQKATTTTPIICEIPGLYHEYDLNSTVRVVVCALISNNACVYVPGPCNKTSEGAAVGSDSPAPFGFNVPEGQNFYARYDDDGVLQVNLITSYTTDIRTEADGTSKFILTIQP